MIDAAERTRRLDRIWDAVATQALDAIVVIGHGVIGGYGQLEYVTGYSPVIRAAGAVLTPGAEPGLVVSTPADGWYAKNRAGLKDVRVSGQGDIVSAYDDLASGLAATVQARGAATGRIGTVGCRHTATAWEAERLRAALPAAELVDVTDEVARIKGIKEPAELERLADTAAIADDAFEDLVAALRPGVTGWEVNGIVERAVRSRGARDTLIFVSADAYFLERPNAQQFQSGDLVTAYIEIVGPNGYWIELARLIALGELDPDRTAIADACLAAARDAASALAAGRLAADAAKAIDAVAASAGLNVGIWHGHGVGVDHDPPVLTVADTTPLVENMVIAVHPNFSTADERLGASVADTYVIGTGAPRRLSRIDPGLLHVGA